MGRFELKKLGSDVIVFSVQMHHLSRMRTKILKIAASTISKLHLVPRY